MIIRLIVWHMLHNFSFILYVANTITKWLNVIVKCDIMTQEQIIEIANQNNGYLYSKLVKENQIQTENIVRLVKSGKLTKVDRGIYKLEKV